MELLSINCFPVELITEILIKTDGKTVGKCRRVCKQWKSIIDNTDFLWEKMCLTEFRHQSLIAKEKRHHECKWYHIYRNFIVWNKVTNYEVHLRKSHDFSLYQFVRNLSLITQSNTEDTRLTLPFLWEGDCPKIENNDYALVVLFKSALVIIRNVENTEYLSEKFYQANGYSLYGNKLYFHRNKQVFKCDLLSKDLHSKLYYNSDLNVIEIQHFNGQTFLFTRCGKIVIISNNNVRVQSINCPLEWVQEVKHICAIDNRNYICYAPNLFKMETDKYRHLYMYLLHITALFFYGDFVLLGTTKGEILQYRQSTQKSKPIISHPNFELISQLPDDQYAVQLDVSEKKSGPVIIVTTLDEILFLEIDFFDDDRGDGMPLSEERINMYNKLTKISNTKYLQQLKVQ